MGRPGRGSRTMRGGLAGWLAGFSMESKLTPLLLLASLVLGAFTLWTMPSEEEPQIIVPVADLYLPLPGAEPEEVENRLLIPLEQVVSGIEGVEYVYSHADAGFGLLTVRFEVGRDPEESVTRLLSTLLKHADRMPPGLSWPLVKTVSIDDVPFFSVTLSSTSLDVDALRSLADEVRVELAT
ncbi:MAG: efflux RND transporter permease subunit, partial [Gemmatimonadetes bacterium]